MAQRLVSQKNIEESDRLFDAYMSQKQGQFSHDDLIEYVEKHASEDLLELLHLGKGAELIK